MTVLARGVLKDWANMTIHANGQFPISLGLLNQWLDDHGVPEEERQEALDLAAVKATAKQW